MIMVVGVFGVVVVRVVVVDVIVVWLLESLLFKPVSQSCRSPPLSRLFQAPEHMPKPKPSYMHAAHAMPSWV